MSKTEINVFLASSSNLEEERKQFPTILADIENTHRKSNIHLIPKMHEFESGALSNEPKQNTYNKLIELSDVFVIIFHKKAGEYTIKEFNVAYELLKKKGKLSILVYYKNLNKNEKEEPELTEFKKYIKKVLGQFSTHRYIIDKYEGLKGLELSINREFSKLIGDNTIGKKYNTFRKGFLLNQKFQPSLISFNILKYLAFNRLKYSHIWIGSIKTFDEIQNLERSISWNDKSITYRNWSKEKASSFNYNTSNKKTLFLTIEDDKDFIELQKNYSKLKSINNVILCFDLESSALSKIYAIELFLRMNDENIKLITENNDIDEKINLSDLTDYLHNCHKLKTKLGLPIKKIKDLIEGDNIIYNKLNNNIKNVFINYILTFGKEKNKKQVIRNIKNSNNEIYRIIKTTLSLVEFFINNLSLEDFKNLLSDNRSLLNLLANAKNIHIQENFYNIIKNELPNTYFNKNGYPKNKSDFWKILEANQIKNLSFEEMNTVAKYLTTISKPYSFDEFIKIKENTGLRFAYTLISEEENNLAHKDILLIEENLSLYEI